MPSNTISRRLWTAMLLAAWIATPSHAASAGQVDAPAGISDTDWSGIQRHIQDARYDAASTPSFPGALEAGNHQQQMRLRFDNASLQLSPTSGGTTAWELRLKTLSYGRNSAMTALTTSSSQASANRVAFSFAALGLTEWYINTPVGVEHGYTIEHRPGGEGPVSIAVGAAGLAAHGHASDGLGELAFVDIEGNTRLHYGKLLVKDGNGRRLPARMHARADGSLQIDFDDARAQYPVTVDPLLVNPLATLKSQDDPVNVNQLHEFGTSVAVDGDTAVIGDDEALGRGAAYVYLRSGGNWSLQARLITDDDSTGFATAVAISGDWIIVGQDSRNRALVFKRENQSWSRHAELPGAEGGVSVALSGSTALIGAPESGTPSGSGGVGVFVRDGDSWNQQAWIPSVSGLADARFGLALALRADTALIGEPRHSASGTGLAYIFKRSGSSWSLQSALPANGSRLSGLFGGAVALEDDDVAIVGAPFADTVAGADAGSAYVFVRNGNAWSELAKLDAPDGTSEDYFGASVSVSQDKILIGARKAGDKGASYLFNLYATSAGFLSKLVSSSAGKNDNFGAAVVLAADTALIGAPQDQLTPGNGGSVTVFAANASSWTQQLQLSPTDGTTGDAFGGAIAISGDIAVIGAPLDNTDVADAGSVYVFIRAGSDWVRQAKLMNSSVNGFGTSVSVSGNRLLVGAPAASKAFIYVRDGNGVWNLQAALAAPSGNTGRYGEDVALNGGTALVGGGYESGKSTAYVYTRSDSAWKLQSRLLPTGGSGSLSSSVALDDDTALVGYPYDGANGKQSGSVYVYLRSGSTWTQQARLMAGDAMYNGTFGLDIALFNDTALVAAGNGAYVFERAGTDWSQQAKLNLPSGSLFMSTALNGEVAVLGGSHSNRPITYLYTRRGSAWPLQNTIESGTAAGGFNTVALSGETLLTGSATETGVAFQSGLAYLYTFAADYGDALDPGYPSLRTSSGARHLIDTGGPTIGVLIDAEIDASTNSGATADDIANIDDEDGIAFGSLMPGDSNAPLSIAISAPAGSAKLDAWIDFNRDGDWADVGEQILDDRAVLQGDNLLAFAVPIDASPGLSIARLRLSTNGVASFTGQSSDGEVQDEQVTISNLQVCSGGTFDFTKASRNIDEKNLSGVIGIVRTGPNDTAVSVSISSADETASAPDDYAAISGAVIDFPAGQTQVNLPLTVVRDALDEELESFTLGLHDPAGNSCIGNTLPLATITITDNNGPPKVGFTKATASANEPPNGSGDATKNITLKLSAISGKEISVPVYCDACGFNTAVLGSGTVVIPPGQINGQLTLLIKDDGDVEGGQMLTLTMGTPINAKSGSITATTVTISDNE